MTDVRGKRINYIGLERPREKKSVAARGFKHRGCQWTLRASAEERSCLDGVYTAYISMPIYYCRLSYQGYQASQRMRRRGRTEMNSQSDGGRRTLTRTRKTTELQERQLRRKNKSQNKIEIVRQSPGDDRLLIESCLNVPKNDWKPPWRLQNPRVDTYPTLHVTTHTTMRTLRIYK